MNNNYKDILYFGFGKSTSIDYGKPPKFWFIKDFEFYQEMRSRFLYTYELAASHQLDNWKNSPLSCLVLVILLNQFLRNIFRQQPQLFVTDSQALELAKYAICKEFEHQLFPVQRWFTYLPFEHTENLTYQHQAVA